MKKRLFLLIILLIFTITNIIAQVTNQDEEEIRQLIGKISEMWTTEQGYQIAETIFSEKVLVVTVKGAQNKEEYLRFIKNIYETNKPLEHQHTVYKIVMVENIAYEYGLIQMKMKNGQVIKAPTMNVFIKEDGVWRILSNMPVQMIQEVLNK